MYTPLYSMKQLMFLLSIFITITSYTQGRRPDISRLSLESKIIGQIPYPLLYPFKSYKLILNGAGTKKSGRIDAYSCGLYLSKPETDPNKIINEDEVMIVRMDILSNKISGIKMVDSFKEGLTQTNPSETLNKLNSEIELFLEYIEDFYLEVGDKIDIIYEPYKGLSVYVNYKKRATISGLDFKKAIYNIWLSNNPVDLEFKTALLDGAKGYGNIELF